LLHLSSLPGPYYRGDLGKTAYRFKFFTQWSLLKAYLKKLGIGLIGDIPLFVGYHSSDVWAGQKYFQLKRDGSLKYV
jgi:4-alpha-glucanotransferase